MLIENSFEVEAPIDHVWSDLLDVEKIVPCMPGAELRIGAVGRRIARSFNRLFGRSRSAQ